MKKTQLVRALQALSQCAPADTKHQLDALAAFIEQRPGASVGPILKTLEAGRKAGKAPRRSPESLRSAVVNFARIVGEVGTKGATSEIDRLSALLPSDLDCSLPDFLQDLDALTAPPPAKKNSAPPKSANEPLARKLAAELDRVKDDAGRFPHLMQTLKDAKQVDTPTLRRVGEIFLPQQKLGSGRKPVLDALLARHHDELRYAFQESSLEALRK